MTTVIAVKGTEHGEWADAGSPFRTQVLEPNGFSVYPRVDFWSQDVSGLPKWLSWFARDKFSDWEAGGDFLASVLEGLPYEKRNLLSHSHGLQPIMYAARQVKIRRVIDVCGPVREDLMDVCMAAAKNIGYWVHVASKGGDKMQFLGEAFDGFWGWVREHPCANRNIVIPKIGHSGLLYDQRLFHLWTDELLLAHYTTDITALKGRS